MTNLVKDEEHEEERTLSKKVLMLLIPFFLFCSQVGAVEKEERNWQDEIVYTITIDRFFNGDAGNDIDVNIQDPLAFHGGDFKGVMDKLDYIKELGFTTISLSAVVNNGTNGYHGYWPEDFYEIEEHFGTMDEFKQLVQEAHNKDIKIIVDLPITHLGADHPWLEDTAMSDWFSIDGEDGTLVSGLPQLNHEQPEVEQYLIEMALWWISETNIDGYRLVNVDLAPTTFWENFASEVKQSKEDFILIADKNNAVNMLDSFQNTALYEEATITFREVDQPLQGLYENWLSMSESIEEPLLVGNFIDHDQMSRFTRELIQKKQNPETRLKLALTYLYGAPGIPMVYYGTEIALDGGELPDNHRMMAFRSDKVIIDHMTKLAEIRQHHSSLRYGDFELLFEDPKGMAVFKRTYEDESTIVAINNSSETLSAEVPVEEIGEDLELRALLNDEVVRSQDGTFMLTMDRETANIYMLHERTGLNWTFILGMFGVWTAFGLFIFLVKRRTKKSVE